MPVVESSAYNTAGQITALVRSLLNDAAGNLFTDTVLLPYVNSAYRKSQRALANVQSGSFLREAVPLQIRGLQQFRGQLYIHGFHSTKLPHAEWFVMLLLAGRTRRIVE